jgi:hypothetical protein
MKKLVGDERGIVTVEFTTEALTKMVELWNGRKVRDEWSARVILSIDEYEPGHAELVSTLEWDD